MPTPTKGTRLGGGAAHQRRMLSNLAVSLFEHGSIRTTETKAKRLRPVAERLITKAKRGDLAARRQVQSALPANSESQTIIHKLFTEIAPAMAERPGGYTRIIKIGNRQGDNAPMAVIELVMEPYSPKQATVKEAEAATARAVKEADEAAAEDDSADDAAEGAEDTDDDADEAQEEATDEDAADSADEEAQEAEESSEEK